MKLTTNWKIISPNRIKLFNGEIIETETDNHPLVLLNMIWYLFFIQKRINTH